MDKVQQEASLSFKVEVVKLAQKPWVRIISCSMVRVCEALGRQSNEKIGIYLSKQFWICKCLFFINMYTLQSQLSEDNTKN